jgi:hypothetical protein
MLSHRKFLGFQSGKCEKSEEFIEYYVGEIVLVGMPTDKGEFYVKGKVEERIGKFLYRVKIGTGEFSEMYIQSLFMKKAEQQ